MYYPSIFNEDFANSFINELFGLPVDYGKKIRNDLVDTRRCTTDIKEYEDRYEFDMEFPGFEKEEIKAELRKGYLVVSAEHAETKEEPKKQEGSEAEAGTEEGTEAASVEKTEPIKYICRERFHGKTERSFYVGKEITKEDIKAKYSNGILTLQIPKKLERRESENETISIL